jgi:hypothetical protein
MTIQARIDVLHKHFWCTLPPFYVDFLTQNDLQKSRTFVQDLTLLYGVDDLANHQPVNQQYLPNHLKIGDNGGDYGIFIDVKTQNNTAIYMTEMGNLDETSLEKLAESFEDWAKKDFDTEIFLDNLYYKQDQFRRSQINAPLLDLKEKISDLNKQLNALSHQKSSGELDLKNYLLQKKEIELNKENLAKELAEHELTLSKANIHEASRASPSINTRIIENTFDLKLPLLYKKLENDGMLEYANAFSSDWYAHVYPTLKNQPPFLMFAQNFELLSLHDVYEALREMPSNTHWLPDFNMIPFAGDGSGDRYAFYNDGENEHAIIYWWHDSDHCDILAKNLQDFIFIKMLDCALEMTDDYDLAADGDAKINLNNWLKTHQKYLSTQHAEILSNLYQRELQYNEDDETYSLINSDEYKTILKATLGFEGDLGRFKYC